MKDRSDLFYNHFKSVRLQGEQGEIGPQGDRGTGGLPGLKVSKHFIWNITKVKVVWL